ncbi:AAA family ATPase, partial [Alistipes senegalensis]
METTDNHTPTPEELALCIEESAVRAADACEQSPAVLRVDGSVIGTLGNFSASIGKAKSKKTFNVAALTAAALTNGTVLHYRASFPEEKRGILYIDTEQGRPHCQQVLRRILRLAGLPEERDPDNLVMLTLRKFPPDMRLAIVDHAIGTIPHLGLVIIDGIRDLLYDINSPKEATDIISRFMQWTDDRQIHIHTILHQNKNDENARGHIGTELNNKAETVMQIEVDKEERSISVVEAIHIRDREFEPFAFRINSETL